MTETYRQREWMSDRETKPVKIIDKQTDRQRQTGIDRQI